MDTPAARRSPWHQVGNLRCSKLSGIAIPNSVSALGVGAFWQCQGMTNVSIPEGIARIENYTFEYCDNLTSVTIPAGVTYLGESAFANCSKLKSVIFEGNAPMVGIHAFRHVAPDFKIAYHTGATGFTFPIWTDCLGAKWPSQELPAIETIKK